MKSRFSKRVLLCVGSAFLLGCGPGKIRSAGPVTIDASATHQIIDGFGASATGYVRSLSSEQMDRFFRQDRGLGLTILRVPAIAGTSQDDCGCVANDEPARCTRNDAAQIPAGDLETAQKASAMGVHIIAAPWSPPAEMKSSGKYCTSGAMLDGTERLTKYAGQLTGFLLLLKQNGVSVDAISIQNEPDVANKDYDTCTWTAKQIHDFVPILYSSLQSSGFSGVKIAAPEQSNWSFELLDSALADPRAADKVGIIFGHAYSPDHPTQLPDSGQRHVWQTEVGAWTGYDGSMKEALHWARSIHDYLNLGANAWLYWNLDCSARHYNHGNNMCLTDSGGKLAKRAFVLGQYAKFIRPGWRRIEAVSSGQLLVTAYKSAQGNIAIVVINPGSDSVENQAFSLRQASTRSLTATPWVTSKTSSLAKASPIALQQNSFTYTIPAQSVVTFEVE